MIRKIQLLTLLSALLISLSACSTIESYKDKGVSFDSNKRGVAVSYQSPIFIKGSPALTTEGEAFADHIAQLMKDNPNRSALIDIEHEKVGSRALNNGLYETRSLSLMKALISRGIQEYRLAFVEVNHKKGIYPPNSRLIFLDEDIKDFQRPSIAAP